MRGCELSVSKKTPGKKFDSRIWENSDLVIVIQAGKLTLTVSVSVHVLGKRKLLSANELSWPFSGSTILSRLESPAPP
jgi:hypothetical protein